MKRQLIIALAVAMAAPAAFAVTDAQLKAVKKSVSSVPVPELPARAAELVTQAQREDRAAVAETAVRAAIYKSRPSAPLVVAAISKAAPEVAGSASRVAAEMEAGQSESISAAASGAAPTAKMQIVSGVQQGLYSGTVASSTGAAPFSAGSFSAPSGSHVSSSVLTHTSGSVGSFSSAAALTPVSIAPSVSESGLTVRGDAKTEHGGHVEIHFTPINHEHGGNGHGRFDDDHRPGHGFGDDNHDHDRDDQHHGKPPICDYTRPRHF